MSSWDLLRRFFENVGGWWVLISFNILNWMLRNHPFLKHTNIRFHRFICATFYLSISPKSANSTVHYFAQRWCIYKFLETFDCTNTGTQFTTRAQNNQLISVTALLTFSGMILPVLVMLYLLANLTEFSTAKDGFMWAEDGFYVYSQSGLGDLSKVCSSIRTGRKQGWGDEKEKD